MPADGGGDGQGNNLRILKDGSNIDCDSGGRAKQNLRTRNHR